MINRIERDDDRGATLLLALFIITTIALVMGALMTSVDTSERTTIALRAAAASTYNAEYVALTQLQADAFVALDAELARSIEGIVATASIDA